MRRGPIRESFGPGKAALPAQQYAGTVARDHYLDHDFSNPSPKADQRTNWAFLAGQTISGYAISGCKSKRRAGAGMPRSAVTRLRNSTAINTDTTHRSDVVPKSKQHRPNAETNRGSGRADVGHGVRAGALGARRARWCT